MKKSRFAERLQRVMTERNLNQSDLAKKIWGEMKDERGYTVAKGRQQIGRYLSGKAEPNMSTKRRLAEAAGVPLVALDPESDPTNRPGSGIYVEAVDNNDSRIEINIVVPKAVAKQVVEILVPYAV